MTKNTNVPPLGRTFTQGAASCGACAVLPWGEIRLCTLHASAPDLLKACQDMLKAADELMTEYVSKKRAANWGVINQAMFDASAAIAQAKGKASSPSSTRTSAATAPSCGTGASTKPARSAAPIPCCISRLC